MVEDTLQASLPGFVDAVRIADVGQGTNPLRIVSMRALPDQPGHPDYPREEWVGLDQDQESKQQATAAEAQGNEDTDTDQTSDYLVSYCRKAHPLPIIPNSAPSLELRNLGIISSSPWSTVEASVPQHPSHARVLRRCMGLVQAAHSHLHRRRGLRCHRSYADPVRPATAVCEKRHGDVDGRTEGRSQRRAIHEEITERLGLADDQEFR